MKIIYDTKTGHSKTIALKVSDKAIDIKDVTELSKDDKVILVTHTEGKGLTPPNTESFMKKFSDNVIGYVVTGNYIKHPFEFGWVGLSLHKQYGKPIIRLIQQEGNDEDIKFIKDFIENLKNFG